MIPLYDTDRPPGRKPGRPFLRSIGRVSLTLALAFHFHLAFAGAVERPCPQPQTPPGTRCYAGRDANGAYYWIAIPKDWNHLLIVHSHGGPSLTAPTGDYSLNDLKRFSAFVREGYAWIGSSYRREGFGVTAAAEDTDSARAIFWDAFGKPRKTVLHGQSWGAGIAVKTAELNPGVYDGIILTNGVLGGGTGSYDFRVDLRAVYQFYCGNHPSPNDSPYPLWQGLAAADQLTHAELTRRVNDCTGIDLPAAQRSTEQRHKLGNILAVTSIPERALVSHMVWSTFSLHDLVVRHLAGGNPFGNADVVYSGSDDDAALNRGVVRFSADPAAVHRLSEDADLSGQLDVPTLSLHAINDPTAFVELESSFKSKVVARGAERNLLQIFTDEDNHQRLSNSEYAAALRVMRDWMRNGRRPDPRRFAKVCAAAQRQHADPCFVLPDYLPRPLSTRVPAREPGKPRP